MDSGMVEQEALLNTISSGRLGERHSNESAEKLWYTLTLDNRKLQNWRTYSAASVRLTADRLSVSLDPAAIIISRC